MLPEYRTVKIDSSNFHSFSGSIMPMLELFYFKEMPKELNWSIAQGYVFLESVKLSMLEKKL